jgi:hypothetical protein
LAQAAIQHKPVRIHRLRVKAVIVLLVKADPVADTDAVLAQAERPLALLTNREEPGERRRLNTLLGIIAPDVVFSLFHQLAVTDKKRRALVQRLGLNVQNVSSPV